MALRILVVDDDGLNLRIAARVLKGLGHNGALANNGEQALRLAQEQAFDLLLLDINMPVLSGEETLRMLRDRERRSALPALPVLMVSGYEDDSTRSHFLGVGAQGFIAKPLDPQVLEREIRAAIRLARC